MPDLFIQNCEPCPRCGKPLAGWWCQRCKATRDDAQRIKDADNTFDIAEQNLAFIIGGGFFVIGLCILFLFVYYLC